VTFAFAFLLCITIAEAQSANSDRPEANKEVSALFGADGSENESWFRSYEGSAFDSGIRSFIAAGDGGFLGTGVYQDNYELQMSLFKLDRTGAVVWQQLQERFPSTVSHGYSSLIEVSDGFLVLAPSRNNQVYLRKINGSGEVIWSHSYEFSENLRAVSIGNAFGGDGCLILAETWYPSYSWAMAVDASGSPTWVKKYPESGLARIEPLEDGGFLLGGSNSMNTMLRLVRISPTGDVEWAKSHTFDAPGQFQYFGDIARSPEGGFLITGAVGSKIACIRTDNLGSPIWTRFYTPEEPSHGPHDAVSGIPLAGGGYLVSARRGLPTGFNQYFVFTIDSDGNLFWHKVYGGPDRWIILESKPTEDGGFVLAGVDYQGRSGWVLKADEGGNLSSCESVADLEMVASETTVLAENIPTMATSTSVNAAPYQVSVETSESIETVICPGSAPSLSIEDGRIVEGDAGSVFLGFNVWLSEASVQAVEVSFHTVEQDAKDGLDYWGASGTVRIDAGATETSFSLFVKPDTVAEHDETFKVILTEPRNATIEKATAFGTIVDDDSLRTLTINRGGTGSGLISGGNINCGSACTVAYRRGTQVSLIATADPNSVFAGWTGACAGGLTSCVFEIGSDTTVGAEFRLAHPLFVVGGAYGKVTSADAVIDCGSTCLAKYDPGSQVTLTAVANAGAEFVGWLGSCAGTGPCQLIMDQPHTVVARFSPIPFVLTVSKEGTGSGRVFTAEVKSGSGPGYLFTGQAIDCGNTCAAQFYSGEIVSLVARADPGSTFKRWDGECSGAGPCVATMGSSKTVVAVFEHPSCSFTLESGSVAVSSAGGSGSAGVSAAAGCGWTTLSLASWITIVSGESGSGNGVVNYSVSPNSGPARSGSLSIAGQLFTVQQSAGCSIGLSPPNATAPADGGVGAISVTAACDWTAASAATWVAITKGFRGAGNGTVEYSVLPNSSTAPKEARLSIGGQTFTITQPGASCPLEISSDKRIVDPGGGSYALDISVPGGCAWNAQSQYDWIRVVGATGTGSGPLTFTAAPNPSITTRAGKIQVNNSEIEIIQPGVDTWFTAGPNGGDFRNLANHPSNPGVVFAASSAGVFKTTDGGLTWKCTTSPSTYASKVAISPVDPDWVWATGYSGLLRTTDGGANWKALSSAAQVSYLAPHPDLREVVYAGGGPGVSKATDGETFVLLNGSPPYVASLAIDPVDPNRILISTRLGFFRTTDGGLTWLAVENGPPKNENNFGSSFLFDAGNHDLVYAATPRDGFWRSTDGGKNWTMLQTGTSPICSGLSAVDRFNPGHVYLGGCGLARRSTDGGLTWEDFGTLPDNLLSVVFLGGSPAIGWLAGTSDGLWRSAEGIEWNPDGGRLFPAWVNYVSVDPFSSRVYGSLSSGMWTSDDRATSWVSDPAAPEVGPLVFDPSNPAVHYLLGSGDIHRTTDDGVTWTSLNFGGTASALLVDPADPVRLYALSGGNLYASSNGGGSWQAAKGVGLPYGAVTAICSQAGEPGVIYAGTWSLGVMRSTDHGATWVKTSTPSPFAPTRIYKIATHPLKPSTLFASATTGLFESSDAGVTWRNLFPPFPIAEFAIASSDPARLWLITELTNREVFQSSDGGATWGKTMYGLAPGRPPKRVAVDPADPNRVYLTTNGGIYTKKPGVQCGSQLETTTATVAAEPASGTVSFDAVADCTWLVESQVDWIRITTPPTGTGKGQVGFSVEGNDGQARTGTIRVAGQDFTVLQGSSCKFSLSEASRQFPAGGGVAQISISTHGTSCPWTAVADQPWIYLEGQEGSNWADLRYTVFNNTGPARTGHIVIAGLTYGITQRSGLPRPSEAWGAWSPAEDWKDVQAGDFNGDHLTDIAGRSQSNGQWWVCVSKGKGFQNELWGSWPAGDTWADVNVGDFNGDGKDDIVGRVVTSGEWRVALSTGSAFVNQSWGSWDPGIAWADVRVGDFNHDGMKDVVGRNPADGMLSTGASNGSGFVTSSCGGWKPGAGWTDVRVAGHFGRTDTLMAVWSPTGEVWFGHCFPNTAKKLPSGVTWVDPLVTDVNGDGYFEIVRRVLETGELWLTPLAPMDDEVMGQWSTAVTWTGVRAGDFNGDGRTDIVGRAEETGEIWVALAVSPFDSTSFNSEASFINQHWDTWRPGVTWVDEVTGDFNGDGATDLAARALESGKWLVRLGTPGRGLLPESAPLVRTPSGNRRRASDVVR